MRPVIRLQHLQDDVRVEHARRRGHVAHGRVDALGFHHVHDAGQVSEHGEDSGRLRRDERRAVHVALGCRHRIREIADVVDAACDVEQALLLRLIEGPLSTDHGVDDRLPDIIAAGSRRLHRLVFENALVVDLFDGNRRDAGCVPGPGRSSGPPQFVGIGAQQFQQTVHRVGRRLADEGHLQNVVVVQEPGRFGHRLLGGHGQARHQ